MDQKLFAIVGLYAGLSALILLWLSTATVQLRAKYKISIGDGDNTHLKRIMRGHVNALENMLIVLILMLAMAGMGAPASVLHGFGVVLVVSRLVHAHHFIQEDAAGGTRRYSMVANYALILIGSLGIIGHSLLSMFS